ncbi:MAG: hypothetical protein HQK49_22000 [Oligoflexia bacterium]|nr:hypothetical protein [Oligoflexia bacterium]
MEYENNEKVIKTPSDYANYSIRLTADQKKIVDSTGKNQSASIKEMITFYKNWKDVDINLRTDLKISCNEFCDIIKDFIKANDANDIGMAAHYKELMLVHASYIRRLYHHIDDARRNFFTKTLLCR